MNNKIIGVTVEADWSYFSDPVRVVVHRMRTTPRVYHVRPASAIRSSRAVLALVQRIVGKRQVSQ